MKKTLILCAILSLSILGLILSQREPRQTSEPSVRTTASTAVSLVQSNNNLPSVGTATVSATSDIDLAQEQANWRSAARDTKSAQFQAWTEQFLSAGTAAQKQALIAEGIALATERRSEMASLIRNDPEQALLQAVPQAIRDALPTEISDLLEEHVAGIGQLAVLAALPEPGKESQTIPLFRTVTLGDRTFDAYVYGWREGQPTRNRSPVNGIVLDGSMAVNADPLPTPKAKGSVAKAKEGEASSRLLHHDINEELAVADGGAPNPDQNPYDPQPSAYTEGNKNALVIRVDFPDLSGIPVSDATATTIISNIHNFYFELSYGRAGFSLIGQGSDLTPTLRMTNSASYYGTNNFYAKLRSEARSAAVAAGYTLTNYQFDIICFGSVPGWTWAGLGYVGAPGSWIRNSFSTSGGVTAHELGHNFGLNHANFWDTGGKSIIGAGTSVEYGDSFENMGSSSSIPNGHHNTRYKVYLNWLKTNEFQTITSNGTYRIAAHDNAASLGIRGLRIVKNSNTNYWVEFRQKFTSNKWLMNGAPIRWAQNGNQSALLLDTTPGTSNGKTDSALVIGRTFTDKPAGIHITPIGKGGTVPESLDVVVNLGAFPSNIAPSVTIAASSTNANTGQTLTFSASATDGNGDTLAYYWDFGDGNFGTNGPSASKSWSTVGEYVVRCEVSDMKGGVASAFVIVRVGSSTTFQISGNVSTAAGPVQGVRVSVSTTRMAWTDSQGNYSIVGLPAGTYTASATLDGFTFVPGNFVNPISVGPNSAEKNFVDSIGLPTITRQPLGLTNYRGASFILSVAATGDAPLKAQWFSGNLRLPGATNLSLRINNAQLSDSGNYQVIVSNTLGSATSTVARVVIENTGLIQNIFSENFDADSSGNWIVNKSSLDTRVTFNYDYSSNGVESAPFSSSNTTRGLKLEANMSNGVTAAVNVSPVGQNFTGDYRLRFDLWINANGPFPTGGTGSTEHVTAGIGTAGDRVQWNGAGSTADGTWFAVSGEGGAPATTAVLPDYSAFTGTALQAAGSGVYAAGTTSSSRDNTNTYYATPFPGGQLPPITQRNNFPQQTGTLSTGTVGFAWRDVLITRTGSVVEWFIDGRKIAGLTNALSGTNIFVGYWDAYTNVSDNVALSFGMIDNLRVERITYTPSIITNPLSKTVVAGQPASFTVAASGTSPSYQWRWEGTNILGATSSTFTLPNVQPGHAGSYSVIVSNAAGSVTSSSAQLTVLQPPVIITQPAPISVPLGSNALFMVEAQGSPELFYQWRLNGTNLVGRTGSQLSLSSVQASDAGNYSVAITNGAGITISSNALLKVMVPVSITQGSSAFQGNSFGFNISGSVGQVVVIERSGNLQNWWPIQTNTLGADPVAFVDPEPRSTTNEFYRIRLQ